MSYTADDRAMRPIYGCPEKFRESLRTPTATFAEILNGFLFQSVHVPLRVGGWPLGYEERRCWANCPCN